MANPPDYPKLVEQAEKAVAGVKDPELKGIAFQKVLDNLLQSSSSTKATKATKAERRGAVRQRKSGRRAGPAAHLAELVEEGFFRKPKTITQVKGELENRGQCRTCANPEPLGDKNPKLPEKRRSSSTRIGKSCLPAADAARMHRRPVSSTG
jgi:hypothetical protein